MENKTKKSEPVENIKKTKIRFVYQKRLLKEKTIYGLEKGEVYDIRNILSEVYNVPIGEIRVEFD